MTRSTFVLPEAQHDIREAALWYESQEIGLGLCFIREVRSSIRFIGENPVRFPRVEEDVRRALLRNFPYSIYFLSDLEGVMILAVFTNIEVPASGVHVNRWRRR